MPGEVDATDATTRTVIPTSTQASWPPLTRVGEIIATLGRKFPPHPHTAEEVLTYVMEGFAAYEVPPSPPQALRPGSVVLLTTPGRTVHSINPARGASIRWFSLVTELPDRAASAMRIQSALPTPTALQPDRTVVRRLTGEGASITSAAGLECEETRFGDRGTSFRRVGHDRRGVVYALTGHGEVDNQTLDVGEAALVEHAAGLSLHGQAGFHVLVATIPLRG